MKYIENSYYPKKNNIKKLIHRVIYYKYIHFNKYYFYHMIKIDNDIPSKKKCSLKISILERIREKIHVFIKNLV